MKTVRPLVLSLLVPLLALALGCSSEKRTPPRQPPKDYARPLPPGMMALEGPIPIWEWPDFYAGLDPDLGHRRRLLSAVDRSLEYMQAPSSQKYYPYKGITHDRVVASLAAFKDLASKARDRDSFQKALEERFEVYRSVGWNGEGEVLFTAYCEPIYEGSRTPDERYRYPLFGKPADLVKDPEGKPLGRQLEDGRIVPCPTRREIETSAQEWVKGLELVWLADRFDAYVVHVQGSARIKLPDGKEMRIGYAGKTDRPYASVGEALVRDGKIDSNSLSLRGIREYFRNHPEELDGYLATNESFVFFMERDGGPYGSLGVPVTQAASLATDKAVYPRAALAFVDTTMPEQGGYAGNRPYKTFVLDQDTGGAIRSAGRADIFLGTGPAAENLAGYVRQEGKLYYIFLKE